MGEISQVSRKIPQLVSIIIPTYNRRAFLEEAINSCLNQTYPEIEVIVVDDGSTDTTWEFLRDSRKKIPEGKLICIQQENKGPSAARNKGLDAANGEYIKFLDSDDTIEPDAIELYVDSLENNGAEMCIGAKRTMSPEGRRWPITYEPPLGVIEEPLEKFFNLTLRPQGALWFFKHYLFNEVRWNEKLLAREDTDLLTRLLLSGVVVCGAPAAVYNQRYHEQGRQMEKQFSPPVLRSIIDSYEDIPEMLQEKSAERCVRRAFAASMSRTALRLWTEDRNSALRLYSVARKAFLRPELVLLKTYPWPLRYIAYALWFVGGIRLCGPLWDIYQRRKK